MPSELRAFISTEMNLWHLVETKVGSTSVNKQQNNRRSRESYKLRAGTELAKWGLPYEMNVHFRGY